MTNKNDFLNVPISFLVYALQYKLVNQLRLYIALKSFYNGQFLLNDEHKKITCGLLGYKSVKTYNRNMNWLIQHKWVTFRKGYGIIKSFKKLAFKLKLSGSGSVIFIPSADLINFRPFMYGAVITYYMKKKRFSNKRSGAYKGSPYKKRKFFSFDLPHTYLAKILGISKSAVANYRREAVKAGYLHVKKNYAKLSINPDSIMPYRKYEENGHKLMIVDGQPCIRNADLIRSEMIVKRKRNFRSMYFPA